MARVIQLSFGKDDEQLYQELEARTKHMSKSGWIKQAIAEKIERETNQQIKIIDDFLKQK